MGWLGEGLATGAVSGAGVVIVSSGGGFEVPAYGFGWLACCAPNRAAAAARTPTTRIVRFIPISFSQAKVTLPALDPAETGKFCVRSPCKTGADVKLPNISVA
jgi:hypothetical protein